MLELSPNATLRAHAEAPSKYERECHRTAAAACPHSLPPIPASRYRKQYTVESQSYGLCHCGYLMVVPS